MLHVIRIFAPSNVRSDISTRGQDELPAYPVEGESRTVRHPIYVNFLDVSFLYLQRCSARKESITTYDKRLKNPLKKLLFERSMKH